MDAKFVKLEATHRRLLEDEETVVLTHLPMEPCTASDIAGFYPLRESLRRKYDKLIATNSFMCLDHDALKGKDLPIYGDYSDASYGVLEVNLLPCQSSFGGSEPTAECIMDQQAQEDFLKGTLMQVLSNNERINMHHFNETAFP